MPTRYTLLIIALIIAGPVLAQSVQLSPRLQAEMARRPLDFTGEISPQKTLRTSDYLILGLETSADLDQRKVEELGGKINSRIGKRVTVRLPKTALASFLQIPGLKTLHYDPSPRPLNEEAIKHVRADKVHEGVSPLPQGYSAKGVVVGIIDTGIDYRHEDFRDPADPSRSRIAYLWDQWGEEGKQPEGFSYGAEWTREQIETALNAAPEEALIHMDTFPQGSGHGTHVSGTAAGNGGVAYQADLIVVATLFPEASILDAASYIMQRATEMGKPCVINLSLGSNLHAHDGSDFLSESLSQLLDGTEGAAIVASAGNEGRRLSHWGGFALTEEPMAVYYAGGDGVEGYFRIPKSVLPTLEMDIAVDSARYEDGRPKSASEIGRTEWFRFADIGRQPVYQPFFYRDDSLAVDLFVVNFTEADKDYAEFYIWLDEGWNLYNWTRHKDKLELFRFYVRGSGSFDAWFSSTKLFTYSSPEEAGLTEPAYRSGDALMNIYSPCDGRNVLCVGAFTNRTDWIDLDGTRWPWPPEQPVGELADFSSTGPTKDNRIKPEIVAPGKVVASAVPPYINYHRIYFTQEAPPRAVFSGTSMSAPIVAGTIALMLEANPHLTHEEIYNLITRTAVADEQSLSRGALPNGAWGYGKLNAFKAMQATLGVTSGEELQPTTGLVKIFPNPARQAVQLVFSSGDYRPGVVRMRDLNGREVLSDLTEGESVELDVSALPRGLYLLEWTDGRRRVVEKLVLQ
jgi:subtilisin family serine protease